MPPDAGYTSDKRGALSFIEFYFDETQKNLEGNHPEPQYIDTVKRLAKYEPHKVVESYEHVYKLDTGTVHVQNIVDEHVYLACGIDDILNQASVLDFNTFLNRIKDNPDVKVEEMGPVLDRMVEKMHVRREHNRFVSSLVKEGTPAHFQASHVTQLVSFVCYQYVDNRLGKTDNFLKKQFFEPTPRNPLNSTEAFNSIVQLGLLQSLKERPAPTIAPNQFQQLYKK